jgi:Helicase conserved C-terminal domain/Type III restriction enzyme, res subunit
MGSPLGDPILMENAMAFDKYDTTHEPASEADIVDAIPLDKLDDCDSSSAELAMMEQILPLSQFIEDFGDGLLDSVQAQNPPIYNGEPHPARSAVMHSLLRIPFPAQERAVLAACKLLVDTHQPAVVLNAEMGTGKTMMGIATAAALHAEGFPRCLVVSPPHLVYKWRREIIQTVPGATVWVLNGADTLRKLLKLKQMVNDGHKAASAPEFFILGRVRMRMGFNWAPAFMTRSCIDGSGQDAQVLKVAACPHCGMVIKNEAHAPLQIHVAKDFLENRRMACVNCRSPLWALTRGKANAKSQRDLVLDALRQIPSIGERTADRLVAQFGEAMLASMLEDNFHNFINLMDAEGELLFTDRQAKRMERFLGNTEISFGQGGYQPTEFIKRYLPVGYFGCLIVDEGHEYKNLGSAQGQAMGVLASQVKKTILLTGTLMGGYADDLFHLLYRLNPKAMIEDGFTYNERGSIGPGAEAFMRSHGVLIETYKEATARSHRTAQGNTVVKHTSKGPGFGPKGIMRYVVPITVFLKLKDLGGNVLPAYQEEFVPIRMDDEQHKHYDRLAMVLRAELKKSLAAGDHTLMGVVIACLLAWPDCAFRAEHVYHPRRKVMLAQAPSLYSDAEWMPKERELLDWCKRERQQGRRVLVYTSYTATRDTTARLKVMLDKAGFKTAVLRATVDASKREDWLADQVDKGVDVVITNPELVKTGLDLLEFPTIIFMQTGYNVYTLQQAARRSWRIGQKVDVKVVFLGYQGSAQQDCLTLMAKKIAVSQSTSGDMPECGLDILNQDGDSIEVALAKKLVV